MATQIILAIDQAQVSGWAIAIVDGPTSQIYESGVAKDWHARRSAALEAFTLADANGAPVVAVLEDHAGFAFSRGNMSVKSLLGMGAARGRWLEVLDAHGITRVEYVAPSKWRQAVLGLGQRTKADAAKAAAQLHAKALLHRDVGPDEAEAVCIALWAARNVKTAQEKRKKGRAA